MASLSDPSPLQTRFHSLCGRTRRTDRSIRSDGGGAGSAACTVRAGQESVGHDCDSGRESDLFGVGRDRVLYRGELPVLFVPLFRGPDVVLVDRLVRTRSMRLWFWRGRSPR